MNTSTQPRRFLSIFALACAVAGGCSSADDDDGSIDTDGSTSDDSTSSTSTTSSTSSTSSTSTTTSDGSTGDVLCFEPLVACGGECIDPRTSRFYCGARGDCRDENAGEECSLSGVCEEGNGCVETCENCGFEAGTLEGWDVVDLSQPFLPVSVVMAGVNPPFMGLFVSEPTEGEYALVHGFDGDGASGSSGDAIEISQEVALAEDPAQLAFDFRLGWDTTFGATKARLFRVRIDDAETGMPLSLHDVDAIPPNNQNLDAGARSASVDLSAYAGQTIRIALTFTVPEDDTGPALAQIDDVRFEALEGPEG